MMVGLLIYCNPKHCYLGAAPAHGTDTCLSAAVNKKNQ